VTIDPRFAVVENLDRDGTEGCGDVDPRPSGQHAFERPRESSNGGGMVGASCVRLTVFGDLPALTGLAQCHNEFADRRR
jgi:hypothetical protein